MNNQHPDDLSRLERLAAVLGDDGKPMESLEKESVEQFLATHHVDLSSPKKKFKSILDKAKAHRRLEVAQAKRLAAVERVKGIATAGGEVATQLRQRVNDLIQRLGQHNPGQAQMYAREFEKATAEDLAVLEQDLLLLEKGFTENGQGDQKN